LVHERGIISHLRVLFFNFFGRLRVLFFKAFAYAISAVIKWLIVHVNSLNHVQ